MDWLDAQKDLTRLIRIPTWDQQERLLEGEDPREVWGDEEERGSKPRGRVIDVDSKQRTASDDAFDDEVDVD